MARAAGKSAGKPPRMTDNASRQPTEAAMATTGNEWLAVIMMVSGECIDRSVQDLTGQLTWFLFPVAAGVPARRVRRAVLNSTGTEACGYAKQYPRPIENMSEQVATAAPSLCRI